MNKVVLYRRASFFSSQGRKPTRREWEPKGNHSTTGMVMVKVVPLPGSLSIAISPPCFFTIW